MIKIVVLSDSHCNKQGITKLKQIMDEADYIITLGDMLGDYTTLVKDYKSKLIAVKGNCDNHYLPDERIIDIEGVKLFVTHGHKYQVKSTYDNLLSKARQLQANVVLYGHTHVAAIDNRDEIMLVNPGTMWAGNGSSYCYLIISNNKALPRIVYSN